jgi:RNA recognition motif-containing protein
MFNGNMLTTSPIHIDEYSNYINDLYYQQQNKGCKTIFIGNLDSSTNESEIHDLCCKFTGFSRVNKHQIYQ